MAGNQFENNSIEFLNFFAGDYAPMVFTMTEDKATSRTDAVLTPKLWTPDEVAEYWRLKVDTVYRLIRMRKIMFIPVGRSYRIPHEQVMKGYGDSTDVD